MEQKKTNSDIEFEVDLFRPEDAPGIARLFEAVYGHGYPIKLYYDPEKLTHANQTGECHSIVARTRDGHIIGNHNLVRSAPYECNYEWAAGLVLSEYRAFGVTGRIVDYLLNDLAPRLEIEEIFGEPACTQLIIQKMSQGLGFIETALELALMPASLYSKEKAATGRVATLLQFRCYKSKPQQVFIPGVYEEELRFFYSALDDERILVSVKDDVPGTGTSEIKMEIFDFAQVARITVDHVGSDFRSRFAEIEKEARNRNVVVVQVWLRSDNASIVMATNVLRSEGYFLGGILPRWFDADGILMQKIWCNPDLESILLYTDRARDILRVVARDWKQSCGMNS